MKKELVDHLISTLTSKTDYLLKEIQDIQNSKNSDTKSSAGDKHETSREMAQLEIEKLQNQVQNYQRSLIQLKNINIDIHSNTVKTGSLVNTEVGYFFISIGLGKIEFQNKQVFCISTAAPIAKQLLNKKVNDSFPFQNSSASIRSIE